MSDENRNSIRIELTTEQRRQITEVSGVEVSALELTAQELEERIAPTGTIELHSWNW